MKHLVISNLGKCIDAIHEQIHCFICLETITPYIKIFYCQPRECMLHSGSYYTTNKSIETCPKLIAVMHPEMFEHLALPTPEQMNPQDDERDIYLLLKKMQIVITTTMTTSDLLIVPVETFNNIARGRNRLAKYGCQPIILFSENITEGVERILRQFANRMKSHPEIFFDDFDLGSLID